MGGGALENQSNPNNQGEQPLQYSNPNIPNIENTKDKSGFILGIEIAINALEIYQTSTISTQDTLTLSADSTTLSIGMDAGLVMGYQQYFDSEQKHGIKLSSHLYGGTPTKTILEFQDIAANTEFQFIPVKVGADLKYLWDFFAQDNHTLGLSVGLGYELSYFISTDLQINNSMGKKITAKFDDMLIQNVYPTIGLHYYLENHQFEINYRFGGIQSASSSKINHPKDNRGYPLFDFLKTAFRQSSYLSLNYTYKF